MSQQNFFNFLSFTPEKNKQEKHLPTPYFSFLVGTQRVMAKGGEGASINKYMYNNIPARGRAADPARPGIYSSAIMSPAQGEGGGGRSREGRGGAGEDALALLLLLTGAWLV